MNNTSVNCEYGLPRSPPLHIPRFPPMIFSVVWQTCTWQGIIFAKIASTSVLTRNSFGVAGVIKINLQSDFLSFKWFSYLFRISYHWSYEKNNSIGYCSPYKYDDGLEFINHYLLPCKYFSHMSIIKLIFSHPLHHFLKPWLGSCGVISIKWGSLIKTPCRSTSAIILLPYFHSVANIGDDTGIVFNLSFAFSKSLNSLTTLSPATTRNLLGPWK